jgi:biopolymer transport protein ExbB
LLIALRFAFFLRHGGRSTRMAESVVGLCARGDFDEADRVVARARGPIPRALEAGLGQRGATAKAREDAIQESLMHEMPRVERFLSTIGILAAIAPLLGLLGTVTGMIITFEMIASFGAGDPRMMAGGISQALITTAAGLIVAIPVLLAHGFLSSMADRLMADTERYAATLLNVLQDRSST